MKDKKWMRKALSFLLAVFMVTGSMGTVLTAAAEEPETPPTETVEVVPTEAPEATDVPEVTEIPEVTDVPQATEAPEATDVPEATGTPEVTDVPQATEAPEATDVPEATEIPETTEAPEIVDEAAVDYSRSVLDNEFFDSGFAATFSSAQLYLNPTGDELVGRVTGVVYVTHRPQKGQLNERISVCVYDQTAGVAYGYLAADAVHPVPEEGIENQRHTGVFASGVEMPSALLVLAAATEEPVPTPAPTPVPTEEPVVVPTEEPVVVPTEEPAVEPTEEPVVEPTEEPAVEPTEEPAVVPTEEPVVVPTEEPVVEPTEEPAVVPTEEPAVVPTEEPAVEPTEEPAVEPTEEPVVVPTEEPASTPAPTDVPDDLENIDRADVIIPGKPTFEMDKATAELGENITFTIHTKNATKILMYIDGSVNRYIYDVPTDTSTLTMSFSSMGSKGGKRTIAFQAYNGNTPGEKSAEQTITLTKPSVKPQVTVKNIDKTTVGLGENITFTLRIKNATKVLMYIDGSVNRRFEDITPDMTEYTFTMSFSSLGNNGGKRAIAFQAYNGTTAGEKTSERVVTVANESPNKPTVTSWSLNKSTVDLNETITFTINTKNATKMRVYIDGKLNRYIYDVKDGATTFQMSFSTLGSNGGVRTVAFQPYNGNTPGAMSDTKTITISVANKPRVELLKISNPNATLGENITFTLRIKNATKVLMYIDGSVNRRFENITPDMTEYTFTMAFSSLGNNGGKRTIAFQAYNGAVGGDKTSATTISLTSGSSAAPVIANVKIDKTTAVLGEQIKFTVYLDNATKLLMYVDGQVNRRFEDVTTSMSKYEFTMSFSSLGNNGGVRTIQFQPYNGTTAGEKFKAYTITLTTTVVNKPEVVNFTMNPSRVKLNVPVTFTVNTKNATKVVLYVDGKANTSYPTTGDVTVIERAFASLGSGNGVRTIQFRPYYGTTAGELSPAQSLTLYVTDDPLTVTVPAAKQGEDLTVTWTAAGGATKYQLLLTTSDGTAALLGETAALNYTVPGLKLLQPGDYTITIKALSGNTELESVNKAFTVTGDFVFAVRDDSTSIVVVKYNGTASTLTVPSTVAGLPVVEIGAQAFEGNTKLKSVTLPATIEIIGRRAFAECKNLLEVK
ncbi:MAG: leucine-rich repeat protein [Christensenellales bacterium]|nr:leucine-rich repeat protein [Christensenellales bacterium]